VGLIHESRHFSIGNGLKNRQRK